MRIILGHLNLIIAIMASRCHSSNVVHLKFAIFTEIMCVERVGTNATISFKEAEKNFWKRLCVARSYQLAL